MEKAAEVRANTIESHLQETFELLDQWFGLHELATEVTELHVKFRAWRAEQ